MCMSNEDQQAGVRWEVEVLCTRSCLKVVGGEDGSGCNALCELISHEHD